mgnify:FL=1
MNKRYKLIKTSTIIGYIFSFLYLLLTSLLFSIRDNFYWLTLIIGGLTLFNSLYSSYLNQYIKEEKLSGKLKIKLLINTILSIFSVPSFILNLIAYLNKNDIDEYIIIKNPDYKKEIKIKKKKKWYQKANFIVSLIGIGATLLSSFIANIGETSGYKVEVNDFTLTKKMTEEFNAGELNALNGVNAVIESDSLSYKVTEYKPKIASIDNPLPMIIVMPGFTRTKATMSQYAIELSRRNAIVFTIDTGCQGGTTFSGYDENNEMISSTVGNNGLDYLLQYIYNNTEEYPYIDRDCIGAVGHSAGGGNVNALAEKFAGNSYEESIIKAVYISGYIKVSAANRFKNLRCNAAMSYAYYDEGAFRYQGSTSAFEIIAKRFINEVDGKNLGHSEAIIDYEYGDMNNGTYRVIHKEDINHCFEMYDPLSISNTINFFRRSLSLDTNINDNSQTWMVKEIFNGISLVGGFLFIFALAGFLFDVLPLFSRMRKSREDHAQYEILKKAQYSGKDISLVTKDEYKLDDHPRKKRMIDKVLFWGTVVITAIIACLDYIPLARLSMDWFSDAASNTYTYFFPARMMNAVMLWALFNGIIGLILIFGIKVIENLYYKLTNQKEYISWYRFKALKINYKDLLLSLGLAAILFFIFYGLIEILYLIFHQDMRFMLISAAPLNGRMIVTWLIYLVPFFIFYISNSIRVNLSMATEGWSEWKVMLLGAIGNSAGLVFIIIINYFVYFKTGTVYYGYYSATDTSEMWLFINMVFGLIPMMFILPIINRYLYKKSGNVYFGSTLTCMIFIMMSISASVSYIPL